jgi:phosphate starvation-inducible protein PhoH
VVRHSLVQRLVNAYADQDASRLAQQDKKRFDQSQSRLNR